MTSGIDLTARAIAGVPAAVSSASTDTLHVRVEPWEWVAFLGIIVGLLLVDLLVIHRRARIISFREALLETAGWVTVGLGFGLLVWWWLGASAFGQYLSGYLIEQSLSVDNVFVWAVILTWFAVPAEYQFRVLFWGVFGALVLRAAFVVAGVGLVVHFEPILYVFGAFLLWTAWRLLRNDPRETVDPSRSRILRIIQRFIPSTNNYDGHRLFTRADPEEHGEPAESVSQRTGRLVATPLFAVLVMIEATDVLFATDSIPAVLAVSTNTFIVYSSNAFAILGLRSLYFCVRGAQERFELLRFGIAVILAFVGLKMLLAEVVELPIWLSLAVIAGVLAVTVVASIIVERGRPEVAAERSRR